MANGVTAKCLLIVFVAWSAFGSVENKERLKNLKKGFYSKSASYEISRPNWINLVKPSYSTISLETCFQTEFNLEYSYDDYNC